MGTAALLGDASAALATFSDNFALVILDSNAVGVLDVVEGWSWKLLTQSLTLLDSSSLSPV